MVKKNNRNTHPDLDDVHETFVESDLPSPQELVEKKDLEKLLERALKELPVKCRNIFTLKRFGELSNKEIAEKLDISIKTVEAQTTIAMKRLKYYISSHWEVITIVLLNALVTIF